MNLSVHSLVQNLNHLEKCMEMIEYLSATSILDYIFRELAISYQNREDLAHTPSIGGSDTINLDDQNLDDQNQFLKIVKDITSKGFVRNNYKKNLVDLSDVKIKFKR